MLTFAFFAVLVVDFVGLDTFLFNDSTAVIDNPFVNAPNDCQIINNNYDSVIKYEALPVNEANNNKTSIDIVPNPFGSSESISNNTN